jgi:hypothetical protein
MESKKINQLATELAPDLSDLTIIGDPTTGISKKITLSQMASLFTGTVEEYANLAAFPLVGVADTIYIALDTNILYRWNTGTSAYVELSPNIVSSLVFNDANGFDGTINLVGSVATLTITTALTTGSVGFIGASGALLQDNANFFWDDTNNRLGLGTNAPTTALDVFGSGIIGRINGTSTNNAYLGFSSAGTNKWSVGNVQSDHRFRIFSEANSAELISVLQTGEFGIGIANPLTKLHIDGGATALIANLDADVSVAKSISFRSDNSTRINLEVSGTESGSNAGANFFIRRYSDAGALIDTPLTITRSTGLVTIPNLSFTTLTGIVPIANGGTGSATQNFVDLTTTQSIGGAKTFTGALNINLTLAASAINLVNTSTNNIYTTYSNASNNTYIGLVSNNGVVQTNNDFEVYTGASYTKRFAIASTGAATFSSSVTSTKLNVSGAGGGTGQNAISFSSTGFANEFYLYNGNTPSAFGFTLYDITNAAYRFTVSNAGNFLIGTTTDNGYKLNCNGQPGANGYTAWTNYSDSRLKENVTDLDATNILDKICAIRPITYNYNELSGFDEDTRARRISGFIAQELMEVFPEMVGTIKKEDVEYYDTNLSNLNLYLVKAIQEQQAQIEELKSLINK